MLMTRLPLITKNLVWPSELETQALAQTLAQSNLIRLVFIELYGDLGAGKTTFVRHLLRALGITERIKSPTYTVVETYQAASFEIWHFDFYRFTDPSEWDDAGFRDIFASEGLKLAEWPQNARGFTPPADIALNIRLTEQQHRHVELHAYSAIGQTLLEGIKL